MATNVEPFYVRFGSRVREIRELRGLSQAALGRRLTPPVTRASIANVENAKQRVLVHTLVDIAGVLNVPTDALLHDPSVDCKGALPEDERIAEQDAAAAELGVTWADWARAALRRALRATKREKPPATKG